MKFFNVPMSVDGCSFAICSLERILKLLPFFLSQSGNKLEILRIFIIYLCKEVFSATEDFPKPTVCKEKKIDRKRRGKNPSHFNVQVRLDSEI